MGEERLLVVAVAGVEDEVGGDPSYQESPYDDQGDIVFVNLRLVFA